MTPKKLPFTVTEEDCDILLAEEKLRALYEQSVREEDQPDRPFRRKDKRKRWWRERGQLKTSTP